MRLLCRRQAPSIGPTYLIVLLAAVPVLSSSAASGKSFSTLMEPLSGTARSSTASISATSSSTSSNPTTTISATNSSTANATATSPSTLINLTKSSSTEKPLRAIAEGIQKYLQDDHTWLLESARLHQDIIMVSLLIGAVCVLSWCCWLIREGKVEEKGKEKKEEMVTVIVEESWLVEVDVDDVFEDDEDEDEPSMQLLRELRESLRRREEE